MDFTKKYSSTIIYYTLAILTLISAGFFIYVLSVRDVVMWARVIYYVWSAFVIGVIIFDMVSSHTREGKHISGIIVYVLSILAVAMACILYAINSGATGIATDFFNLFISVSIVSLMTTGYMIATWFAGKKVNNSIEIEDNIE